LFAQGVEKAQYAPVHNKKLGEYKTSWTVPRKFLGITIGHTTYYQNYINTGAINNYLGDLNEFESALLNVPGQEWGQSYNDGDWEHSFLPDGKSTKLPDVIGLETLLEVMPNSNLRAGERVVAEAFWTHYLRYIVGLTIWGDHAQSDQVYQSTVNGNSRVDNWGYDPDLYKSDVYHAQIGTSGSSFIDWITGRTMPHICLLYTSPSPRD